MSRRKSEDKTNADFDREERGIGNGDIAILHSVEGAHGNTEKTTITGRESERDSGDSHKQNGVVYLQRTNRFIGT
jgi:hypothetical protein